MTVAGIALIRSVDSATLLASNLAFRQSATASADRGVEAAIAALTGKTAAALEASSGSYFAGLGVFALTGKTDLTANATPDEPIDDFDWAGAYATQVAGTDAAGNKVAYVIHRLCDGNGALDPATCSVSLERPLRSKMENRGIVVDDKTYRDPKLTPPAAAGTAGSADRMRGQYRITVRVTGPRNTHSYVQVIVAVTV
jgi:hypothetical protein